MSNFQSILPLLALGLFATSALADPRMEELQSVEPAAIEQLDTPKVSTESVPEPGLFGAMCLGIATVIYARRWRRRA